MKVQACCMCMPVNLGVKILGCLDILLWLKAAHNGDIIQFTLLMFTCSAFALLLQRDTSMRRRNFFIAYLVFRVILVLMFISRIYRENEVEPSDEVQVAVENVCTQIKEKQGL